MYCVSWWKICYWKKELKWVVIGAWTTVKLLIGQKILNLDTNNRKVNFNGRYRRSVNSPTQFVVKKFGASFLLLWHKVIVKRVFISTRYSYYLLVVTDCLMVFWYSVQVVKIPKNINLQHHELGSRAMGKKNFFYNSLSYPLYLKWIRTIL